MYYNRIAPGKSLQAHLIMPFLTEKAQSAVATTQTGGYINPTKLENYVLPTFTKKIIKFLESQK